MHITSKHCGKCKELKSVENFSRSTRNGLQSWCKLCKKEKDALNYKSNPKIREHIRNNKRELSKWHRELKAGKPCTDCGIIYHVACMQWDHLPQYSKKMSIAQLVSRVSPREIILEEISKCELVCANCHALRTYFRRGGVS